MNTTLNKGEIQYAQKYLKKQNKKYTDEFIEIPKEQWPKHEDNLFQVFRNRSFLVQCFYEENNIIRLSINRTKMLDSGAWSDRITWEELQKIKRDVGYGNKMAVEIFPEDEHIVNVSNMRHLWILDKALSFRWTKDVWI